MFDIALILTNTVFRLGNVKRDCTADRIMKDPSVKQSPVKQALANLKRQITRHKNDRDLYVHRGQMPNIPSAIGSDENTYMKLVSLFQQMELTSTLDREMLALAYTSRAKELCARIQEERS